MKTMTMTNNNLFYGVPMVAKNNKQIKKKFAEGVNIALDVKTVGGTFKASPAQEKAYDRKIRHQNQPNRTDWKYGKA